MKRLLTVLTLAIVFFCFSIAIQPPRAEAFPPVNPICWIMDGNSASYKQHCRGHSWSWPHWGGGSNSDGARRGCGGGPIDSQKQALNEQELNWFRHRGYWTDYGTVQTRLVITNIKKKKIRFWPDRTIYTWQEQSVYQIFYQRQFKHQYVVGGDSWAVEC